MIFFRRSGGPYRHHYQQQNYHRHHHDQKNHHSVADDESASLLSRLPKATELTIRTVASSTPPVGSSSSKSARREMEHNGSPFEEGPAARKCARTSENNCSPSDKECGTSSRIENKLDEMMAYTKKRDEDNQERMDRMIRAIEDIRDAIK